MTTTANSKKRRFPAKNLIAGARPYATGLGSLIADFEQFENPDATGMTTSPSSYNSTHDSASRGLSNRSRVAEETSTDKVEATGLLAAKQSDKHSRTSKMKKALEKMASVYLQSGDVESDEMGGLAGAEEGDAEEAVPTRNQLTIEYDPSMKREKASKKRKRGADDWIEAYSSRAKRDGDRLSRLVGPESMEPLRYNVIPRSRWDSLTKFRKLTWQGRTFCRQDIVLIGQDDEQDWPQDPVTHPLLQKNWIARIIDIRVPRDQDGELDGSDVVVLVQWLYKPEELPHRTGGRKPWHGATEVMPANWFDFVDPITIGGRVHLYYRDGDLRDEEEQHGAERDFPQGQTRAPFEALGGGGELTLYWRQYFNAQTLHLEAPKKHCTCRKPSKLDELMIKCEKCDLWLHATCIENAAADQEGEDKGANSVTVEKKEKDSRKFHIKLTPNSSKSASTAPTYKELRCLKCTEIID